MPCAVPKKAVSLVHPVALIIEDLGGLSERGTAVMEKLIRQDRLAADGGGYHSFLRCGKSSCRQ